MSNKEPIALVIPCYNEASRGDYNNSFSKRLQRVKEEIDKSIVTHIVIVDDGSLDETSKVAHNFIEENSLDNWTLLKMKKNEGKGKALLKGLTFASKLAPYVAYIDADISVSASHLNNALNCCSKNTVVCGHRHYMSKTSFVREIASNLAKMCNKYTIGLKSKDTQCPFKVIPSEGFLKVRKNLKGYRWIFDIELLWELEKRGYYIHEKHVAFDNMDSITLSEARASFRCAKDIVDFKAVRWRRRINYLKNKKRTLTKKEEALL